MGTIEVQMGRVERCKLDNNEVKQLSIQGKYLDVPLLNGYGGAEH